MKGRKAISRQTKIFLVNTSVIGLSTCRSYSIKPKCIHQIEDVDKAYRFERGGIGRRASRSQPGEGAVGTETCERRQIGGDRAPAEDQVLARSRTQHEIHRMEGGRR